MSWFRVSSLIFAAWAVVFFFLPGFANELVGIDYVANEHAEDWTQIFGVAALALAVVLNEAHRSASAEVRRVVARGVLAFTLPCALLMTYWQIIPDGPWNRIDIANAVLLYAISYGMFLHADLWARGRLAQLRDILALRGARGGRGGRGL